MMRFQHSTAGRSIVIVSLFLSLLLIGRVSIAQTNPTAQSLPYFQNFSSLTGSTTTYPAGWQGWSLATTLSTSYSTAAATADQALAGATNNTSSAFVGDMAGKIGFLSTGSNLRFIALAVNTSSLTNINVSYTISTQSQVYQGRIDKVALQYRVGTSGTFTTIAGTEYWNNVYSGITSATTAASNSSVISVTLPAACNGNANVQLRWVMKDSVGAGNRPSFSITNVTVAAASQITNYYNASGTNLDNAANWGTATDGSGSHPSNFTTAGQVFNIHNSNTGITASTWTVSGNASKIIVEGTNFTIPSGKTVTGLVDVNASRTLTLQNSTFPTLNILDPASTVNFNGLTSITVPSVLTGYGNIVFDGTSVANPGAAADIMFAGNFTLQNTGAAFNAANYNLNTRGTQDQFISANGFTLTVRNLDNNVTNNKTGSLHLGPNTAMTISNSIAMMNFGSSNSFSDSTNTLTVANNVTDSGNAAGYNLTGTLTLNAASGTQKIQGGSNSTVVCPAQLNNLTINSSGTAGAGIYPTTGGSALTIKGNFTLTAVGSGNATFNSNTIQIGGNFTFTPSTAASLTLTGSTVQFNGTSGQTYSSNIATNGNTFVNLTINNSAGLTLNNPLTVSGVLNLTSGKIATGTNAVLVTTTGSVTGGSTSSYINGALSKVMPAAGVTNMLFEVGDNNYSPARFGFSASATAGTIKVRSTNGSHPQIGSSAINVAAMVNRYWTVNLASVTSGAYPFSDTFSYSTGDIAGGSNTGFVVRQYNNTTSAWSSAPASANSTITGGVLAANASIANSEPTTAATIDFVAGQLYPTPTITSVSPNVGIPGSGSSGTAITITGTGFNGTAASNNVYFGATKATVSSVTGTTVLNVNVPFGSVNAPVFVENASGGLSAFYKYPFKPTFNNGAFITDSISFKPAVNFSVGNNPNIAAIGDLDGDGKSELVAVNYNDNTISIYKNTSTGAAITTGSFTILAGTYNTGSGPSNVKLADVDGDGLLDIIVACKTSSLISVLRNSTSGGSLSIATKVDFSTNSSTGQGPIVLVVNDFDGDGKPDVAAAAQTSGTFSVLRNTSSVGAITSGSFATGVTFTAGTAPNSICAGDFDGDSKPDLAVLNAGSSNISIFRNTSTVGSFSFASAVTVSTSSTPVDLQSADMDGDTFPDIVLTNGGASSFSIFRNTNTTATAGTITFSSATSFATGSSPLGVALGDINGDGKLDVVVANSAASTVGVYRNTSSSGSLNMASPVTFTTGTTPTGVNVGDLNNDGFPEIVTGNTGAASISVLRDYPLPYITPITGATSVCVGSTTTLSDSVSGGTWSSSNSSLATINSATGVVTGIVAGSPVITYTVISSSDTNYVTTAVTVNASPIAGTITGTTTLCSGATTTLSNSSYSGGTGTWSSSASSVASVDPSTGVVTAVSSGSATITFTVTSATGCGSVITTTSFTVSPAPTVGSITGTTNACIGGTSTLVDATSGGTWSSSASGIATVDPSTGDVTGVSAGSATISYTVGGCGSTSVTTSFTVNANPVAGTITGTTTVCPATSSALSNSTFSGGTGVWSSSSSSVATVNSSTGVVTGVSTGSATITFTVSGPCGSAFTTTTVNVTSTPSAGTITGTTTVCTGSSTTLSDGVSGGTWSSSASGVATVDASSGVVTGVTLGSATITYTVTNSCGTAFTTASYTVNSVPATPAAITGTTTVCTSASTTLSDATSGGTWSSSASGIATVDPSTGVVTGVTVGSATITYTVTNSCGSSFVTTTYTVNTVPSAPASITGTTTICTSATTTLSDATSGGTWSSSASGVATVDPSTGDVTGVTAGSATISYTVTNTCGSTSATTSFTVITTPSTPASITGTTTVCTSATTTLADATSGGTWSSSASGVATVNATTGVVTGVTVGSAIITYTVSNPCGSAFVTTGVTVITTPSAPASITGTTTVCTSASTTLADATSGGTWSSSSSGVATVNPSTGVVTGVTAGSATISYIVSNSCGSASATTGYTVNTVPSTPSSITGTTSVTVGSSSTLSDATSGGAWSSSASGVATVNASTGVVNGVSAGTATITYTVTNTCGSAFVTTTFTVTAITISAISGTQWNTFSGTSAAGPSTFTVLPATTSPGSSNMAVSQWNRSGATNQSTAGVYNTTFFSAATTFAGALSDNRFIYFTITNGSSTEVKVTNVTLVGQRSATGPQTLQMTYSTGSSGNINFGGTNTAGTTSTSSSFTGNVCIAPGQTDTFKVFPYNPSTAGSTGGTYRITNTTSVTAVYANGVSALSLASSSNSGPICAGSTLNFTGGTVSNGVTPYTYSWSGPASFTSTVASPSISSATSAATGTYTFTVTDTLGCTLSNTTAAVVNSAPVVGVISGSSSVCVGANTTLTDTTVSGTWSSSASSVATVDPSTGVVTGVSAGSATISYSKTNSCGTTSSTFAFTVNAAPSTPPSITGTTTVCVAATTTLSNATSGGNWSSSASGVATVDATSGVVTGVTAGSATITYTVTNTCGTAFITTSVTVNPLPATPAAITGTATVCVGATTTLSDAVSGGIWSSSASSVATVDATTGDVTGVAAGSATISYSITNSCGTNYTTIAYSVNGAPTVASISGTSTICTSTTATFTDATSGGTWSSSASGVATVDPSTGDVTGVSAGSATITYTVTNSCGSTSQTLAVTVNATVSVAAIGGVTSLCVSSASGLSDATSGGTWSTSNSAIASVDASGGLYGISAGSATITYSVSSTCGTVFATLNVSIITSAPVGVITGSTHVCTGAHTTLSDTTAGGTWSSSASSIVTVNSSTGVLTGVTAGVATISYSVTGSCGVTVVTYADTVFTSPTVAGITGISSILVGQTITVSDATAGGAWTTTSGAIAAISSSGDVTGISGGTTTISYTITNVCGSIAATGSITVSNVMGAGNLVVFQCNDTLGTGSSISLVEYGTSAGSAISSYTLPSTGSSPRLVCSGTATSEGNMSLDSERTHIIIPGYDTTLATTSLASNANVYRALFSALPSGALSNVVKLSQTLVYNTNNLRGATAAGTRYFGAGTATTAARGGVQYMVGTTTANQVTSTTTNVRTVQVFNGQLYYSTGSGTVGVYAVGTGIPNSTGNTSTIIHTGAGLSSPYGFSISPDANTLYVADDAAGIYRFTRTGGAGSFASPTQITSLKCRGISVDYTTTPYTIYATTATGTKLCTSCNAYSDSLIKVVDAGAGSSISLLAVAPANKNFRAVTFTPTPKVSITATTNNICSGITDSVIFYGNPGDSVNYFADGSPAGTRITATGRVIVSSVYTNLTSAPVTHTYSLSNIMTSLGTFSATGSTYITVNPQPMASITGTAAICAGTSDSVYVIGGTPGASVTLSPGGSTFTLDGSGYGGTRVSPSSNTTYHATVSYLGCTSSPVDSVVVTVNPLPTASISGTASIYAGASTNLSFSGTAGALVTFTLSTGGSDTITLNGSGAGIRSVSPVATTTYSVTTVVSTAGCSATITGSNATVTVTTAPFANISGTATVCAGVSSNLSFSGTGGALVRYTDGVSLDSVTLSGTSGGAGSAIVSVTPLFTTTYSLTSMTTGATTITVSGSATITVNSLPVVPAITGTTSVCIGSTTTLADTATAGTWTSATTSVATISASGVVTGVTTGTSVISYQKTNACGTTTVTTTVTVNPLPTAGISGTATIVSGTSTNIAFTGTASATITYTVNGGSPVTIALDATGNATLSVAPTVTTAYTITSVTSTAGCTQTVSGTANVTVVTPFSTGTLAVVRLGDGTSTLNGNGAANTVIEYTTSGSATGVTLPLPTSGANRLVTSGSATSEGMMSLDSERTHLIISGYDTTAGTGSVASAGGVRRTIFSVLPTGLYSAVADVSQTYAYAGNNMRSATAAGSKYYAGGTSGTIATGAVQLMGPTTSKRVNSSTSITNVRVVQVFNGQLYFMTGSAPIGVYAVGTGCPSDTGNATTYLTMSGTAPTSPYGFAISPDNNTLYLADDAASTGGIFKYTRSGGTGTFAFAYRVTTTGARGLTVDFTTTPYTLYATSNAATANTLFKVTDNGAGSSTTTLATAATNYIFRGVTFTPSAYGKVGVTTAAVCEGVNDTVIFYGNPGSTINYTLNGSAASVSIDNTGRGFVIGSYTNGTPSDVVDTFSLVSVVTSLGTTTITGSATITVHPKPYIPAITGVNTICVGGSSTLADTATYGTWSSSAPSVATVSTIGVVTALSSGSTVVSYSETNACGTSVATDTVIVNNLPTAGAITCTPSSACIGSLLTITETGSISGTGTLISYNWSGPSGYTNTGTATSDTVTATSTGFSGIYSLTVTYPGAGCTSTAVTSSTITVSAPPTAYSVTGGGYYCGTTGLAVGLSNSETGVSYQLYRGGSTVGSAASGSTGSSLSFGTFTTAGTYTILATGPGGCTTAMTGSVTITDASVGLSLGGSPSVCQPIATATQSYSSAFGSPTSYSITYGSSAISAGFTNVSGAGLGGFISHSIPTGATGVFSGTLTVSNSFCTSPGYSMSLTVYANPTAAITSALAPCAGYSTNVVFTGTSGATVNYMVDSASILNATLTGGTFSLSTGVISGTHSYTLLNAHNVACSNAIDTVVLIAPVPMQWTGTISSDWNNASNWSCGFVPGASDDVTIPSGTAHSPDIAASASGTTRNIDIASGVTVTVNSSATLNVAGNLVSNGSVKGSGTLTMNGPGAQSVSGTSSVTNFDVNNTSGVNVLTGSLLTIKSTLSVTSGTLATSDSVVLASDSAGSARVATLPSGSVISGNVKVNQYFTGGRRAYRFWAHPFSISLPLSQMTNYIDISGPGGSANGFTTTASNAPSSYRYDPIHGNSSLPYDIGWRQFASAYATPDSNEFKPYQGIRVYYRGSKGEGLGFASYTPSPTVVSQWGPLNQGSIDVTISKGATTLQDYNMIGNPYASPVDIGTIIYNAANAGGGGRINSGRFYIWNPFLGVAGGFLSIPYSTCDCNSGGSPIPYYIQANDAFQVRALFNGAQLNFTEARKSATITSSVSLMKANTNYLTLHVYDANYHLYDMLSVRFDSAATEDEDSKYDAGKPTGSEFNFYSVSADHRKLSMDTRPYKSESAIPLGVSSNYAQDYIIRAESVVAPDGGKVYLHDKLLKKYVLLQAGVDYKFAVTAENATQGEDRFELSLNPAALAEATVVKGLEVNMVPNPASADVHISFTQGKANQVSVRVLDLSGVSVYNESLGIKQNGAITIPLQKMASGVYMVELTSGDQKVVRKLIKE